MKNELIDVTNALIFALKIDGRKDLANTELIAEAERIVKLFAIPVVSGSLLPLDVHKKARELSAGEFIDWWFAKKQ